MPLTVITVKNAPQALRGDLTKWMQEIATGVYVGADQIGRASCRERV